MPDRSEGKPRRSRSREAADFIEDFVALVQDGEVSASSAAEKAMVTRLEGAAAALKAQSGRRRK